MTPALEKWKAHFRDWREWEPNPVLLKELRQAMRNGVLTGALMLLLAALFLILLLYSANQELLTPRAVKTAAPAGLQLSRAFLAALTIISLVFIPLYAGIRFAMERSQSGFELLFATALPVWRIIRGKFLSAAYIQVLFFSVFFPFLAITVWLRGVDLPAVLFSLACLYVVVCVAAQAALALACLPLPIIGKIVVGILFTGVLLITSWLLLLGFSQMLGGGIGTLVGRIGFWFCLVGFAVAAAWGYIIFYALAVTLAFKGKHLPRFYCDSVARNQLVIYHEQCPTQ